MSYQVQKNGWFTEVNGVPVTQRRIDIPMTSFKAGHPVGIVWHYTAGCGSDLSGVYTSNGFGGAQFSIDQTGKVYQYAPITSAASWHAREASQYYIGIEHSALPGTCNAKEVQLEVSVKLAAALVEYVKGHWGYDIPLRKIDGPALVPGFHDHKDGTTSDWNDAGHVDGLLLWSWDKYLAAVGDALSGDEMTPEQLDTLKDAKGVLEGLKDFRQGTEPPADARPSRKIAYAALMKAASLPKPGAVEPHEHTLEGKAV